MTRLAIHARAPDDRQNGAHVQAGRWLGTELQYATVTASLGPGSRIKNLQLVVQNAALSIKVGLSLVTARINE